MHRNGSILFGTFGFRLMSNLDTLLDEWDRDSVVREDQLGHEASRNPQIHAKYIRWLSTVKLQLRAAESKYLTARKLYYRYYNGEIGKDELKELGWNQYQGTKPLKSQIEELLNTAPELIKLTDKIAYFTTMKETIESILKEINARTWNVKSAIEWTKIQNGII